MTRAEAFDKAWRLGFKGDFSLFDEIIIQILRESHPLQTKWNLILMGSKKCSIR